MAMTTVNQTTPTVINKIGHAAFLELRAESLAASA